MNVLEAAIGWLAPVTCVGCGSEGSALCLSCHQTSILPFGERCYLCSGLSPRSRTCRHCRKGSPSYVWVATDYSGLTKELIKTYKFAHQRAAAKAIAGLMVETFRKSNDKTEISKTAYMVVPVPTATGRVRQRGFDHSDLLSRTVAKDLRLEYVNPLCRLGQANQIGAKRQDRLKQQEGAYRLTDPKKIRGRNILLIDDVVTTGATLRAVTKILKAAGARRVDGLVLARNI